MTITRNKEYKEISNLIKKYNNQKNYYGEKKAEYKGKLDSIQIRKDTFVQKGINRYQKAVHEKNIAEEEGKASVKSLNEIEHSVRNWVQKNNNRVHSEAEEDTFFY